MRWCTSSQKSLKASLSDSEMSLSGVCLPWLSGCVCLSGRTSFVLWMSVGVFLLFLSVGCVICGECVCVWAVRTPQREWACWLCTCEWETGQNVHITCVSCRTDLDIDVWMLN
mmetsp:Transcript_34443/g.85357  ORF Transcript_34443/g.85357 Transcript_34443/m.85357 type:complete len:113 (-) Transcript_34443:20-358(-)